MHVPKAKVEKTINETGFAPSHVDDPSCPIQTGIGDQPERSLWVRLKPTQPC